MSLAAIRRIGSKKTTKHFVVLFLPVNLWGRGSRKKWTTENLVYSKLLRSSRNSLFSYLCFCLQKCFRLLSVSIFSFCIFPLGLSLGKALRRLVNVGWNSVTKIWSQISYGKTAFPLAPDLQKPPNSTFVSMMDREKIVLALKDTGMNFQYLLVTNCKDVSSCSGDYGMNDWRLSSYICRLWVS